MDKCVGYRPRRKPPCFINNQHVLVAMQLGGSWAGGVSEEVDSGTSDNGDPTITSYLPKLEFLLDFTEYNTLLRNGREQPYGS
jgi:hypothetical protein